MTAKRDLKRRVRQRQSRTGESYTTALRNVRDQRPKPFSVEELLDVSDVAAPLGIKCRVRIYSSLADRVEVAGLLRRMRDVLVATHRDRTMDTLRSVVLYGESLSLVRSPGQRATAYERRWGFLTRARAGVGGVNDEGTMLAMSIEGRDGIEHILFSLTNYYGDGSTSLYIDGLRDLENDPPTLFRWTRSVGLARKP